MFLAIADLVWAAGLAALAPTIVALVSLKKNTQAVKENSTEHGLTYALVESTHVLAVDTHRLLQDHIATHKMEQKIVGGEFKLAAVERQDILHAVETGGTPSPSPDDTDLSAGPQPTPIRRRSTGTGGSGNGRNATRK